MTISVLLLDDETLMRAGIRCLIEQMNDIVVVAEVASQSEAIALLEKSLPSILIIDVNSEMQAAISMIQYFKHAYPDLGIIILAMDDSEELTSEALRAGASAYLLKTVVKAELEIALRKVANKEIYLNPEISLKMLKRFQFPSLGLPQQVQTLTARQLQIIAMIGNRKGNKQIAYELGLSPKTVAAHRSKIMAIIGEKDTVGIVLFARKYGLITSDKTGKLPM
ncbi:response regulator transcription factor [Undibacterium sp. SXout7W]|uniref:response regulator transcription factor n=1 Tax=Undibacterium sp. SXout7W TaxID=3413049 RepID=UPI003BF1A163